MTRLLLASLAALLLGACGPSGRLRDLERTQLFISPEFFRERSPNGFRVRLDYMDHGPCVQLADSVRATVNGEDAPGYFPGGLSDQSLAAVFFDSCQLPNFAVPLAAADAPEVTVAFEDGDDRIAATIRSLGTAPSVAVTPPADGHIRPGSTVGLRYTPATDAREEQTWFLVSQSFAWDAVNIDHGAFQDGSGSFTIPAHLPPGPATIIFTGRRTPAVTSCEAFFCDASYSFGNGPPSDLIPFEIEP